MNGRKRVALEAVARHFSATWQEGDGSSDAWLAIAGRRIAVDVATIRQSMADAVEPRLRFDKVALRLVGYLQTALNDSVPDAGQSS